MNQRPSMRRMLTELVVLGILCAACIGACLTGWILSLTGQI